MSQSTFSKVFRKGFSLGEPERPRPAKDATRAALKPASRQSSAPPVRIMYLAGEAREITFVSGSFDKTYPHLVFDFTVPVADARDALAGEPQHEAVVVGWSVPEADAAPLIGFIRERRPHMAIVSIGERSSDAAREAGADEYVQRGASMLTRLPMGIEESVR
jgi:hypothetical protein